MTAFAAFAADVQLQSGLRAAITAHTRAPEPDCVAALLDGATLEPEIAALAGGLARHLVEVLRAKRTAGAVEGLVREYDLSSQEGIALMCLAEALLRIPDRATRDALIRDKIGAGNWRSHVGHSPSLFVNAATWGLVVTGTLTGTANETGLGAALTRLIARGGEPVIRRGVEAAMRLMGEQFVTGETIEQALANSRRLEARGFRYSYDMLGEAAMTAADALRYGQDYERAIHAIGKAAAGRSLYDGPGISIKLSALHPRYTRTQRGRVMRELLPRVAELARLARGYGIGLNIDAEEADRLDLSLDILEALSHDRALDGWDGIGFVVQAYQKRAPFVLDWIVDLARRTGHRIMVRLVKGAYWDSEIKRAQVDGLDGFPVFTRKVHTDLSYLACARKLLDARDVVFPQFATHNAYTVAAIHHAAGERFAVGDWEFQCLHGMGEPLYEEVVGHNKLNRPCRIYAPVGTHETLLAYLVRRLLENGANSSFVNRIQDKSVSVAALAADPVAEIRATEPLGAPNDRIALPRDLFAPVRANSAGLDLSSERTLAELAPDLAASAARAWHAGAGGAIAEIRNPADARDLVGRVAPADPDSVDAAIARAAGTSWATRPASARAACLLRAADLLERDMPGLLGLIVREAGKSLANAVGEVREAVDFLRYYATEAAGFAAEHVPLGVLACISPWNFPLSIFTGQIAAALAAGNAVLAKPAEETPLIAAQAVALLREAGVPDDAMQLLPGGGEVGARLVSDRRINGVLFTGSTDVARLIQRELAQRLNPDGSPVVLVAETGGQNALMVDSSALAEQVVADVLTSAFDSAGQRCSALRVLFVQADVADRTLAMLHGGLAELAVGNPDLLATDIGPVISAAARDGIERHVTSMRDAGYKVHRLELPDACRHGTFVAPTIVELPSLEPLRREVFGPVLHVVRFRRDRLDEALDAVAATGYALTFGVHSRIDEVVAQATEGASAGNIYVNRNLIGAVVGVQPFGGHGLSGTGPKAGGPLYLRRLLARCPATAVQPPPASEAARAWQDWLRLHGETASCDAFAADLAASPVGVTLDLTGPVGEQNRYAIGSRGAVWCVATTRAAQLRQIGAALATGNVALLAPALDPALAGLPGMAVRDAPPSAGIAAILFDGDDADLRALAARVADWPGPIVAIHVPAAGRYRLEALVEERSVSTNTTAAGGNAHLMMLS